MEVLEFCLKSTEFEFRGKYYEQIHGTTMGSPVSVVVANLVMEDLEQKALNTFPGRPRLYQRFVDDTIAALKKTQISQFRYHLNSQDQQIQFTVERYKENGIPFLDTFNMVNDNAIISTTVYRKPTHSDRYLQFTSQHPIQHKASGARTLYSRAMRISSDRTEQREEEKRAFNSLRSNGYPRKFLQNVRRKVRYSTTNTITERKEKSSNGLVILPYIQGITEQLKRVLEKHRLDASIKPTFTLKECLTRPKDSLPMLKQTGVVYKHSMQRL